LKLAVGLPLSSLIHSCFNPSFSLSWGGE
jgi:hypothetical protein